MLTAEVFERLRQSPSGHAFTVEAVGGRDDVFLGVDASQRPCLFVRGAATTLEPQLRTSHVSLVLGQEYMIQPPGQRTRSERLDALRCETSDAGDLDTFLVLVDALLARYGAGQIDPDALKGFFRSMVRLFSAASSSDLQAERQGLWGELFMMSRERGFQFWAPFWHSETNRKFDFSAVGRRVEVKTAVGQVRIHHFAHRQIYSEEGEEIVLASLLLRKEDAGLSLRDLIAQARSALMGTEHYFKLELAIRQAGMEAMDEPGPTYDSTEASELLAWYRASDAPHFTMAEPPGVSQTHYRVDLSTAPRIPSEDLSHWLNSWPAIVVDQSG
jgi:Putative  PD-(D/E)XK family member, (DUF4420)